jgi:hypothetical protein
VQLETLDIVIRAVQMNRRAEGERRLMAEVLRSAISDASSLAPSRDRDDARAWLLSAPGISVTECCDALGIEYDAMIVALRNRWIGGVDGR